MKLKEFIEKAIKNEFTTEDKNCVLAEAELSIEFFKSEFINVFKLSMGKNWYVIDVGKDLANVCYLQSLKTL